MPPVFGSIARKATESKVLSISLHGEIATEMEEG